MDRVDLFHAHIGGIDTLARSLLAAADMIEEGALDAMREARYAGWAGELGRAILAGETSFESLAERVTAGEIDPRPVSGRQELYENVVNRHIWVAEERARIETGAGR